MPVIVANCSQCGDEFSGLEKDLAVPTEQLLCVACRWKAINEKRPKTKVEPLDLCEGTGSQILKKLAKACELASLIGYRDRLDGKTKMMTGQKLAKLLLTQWRIFHVDRIRYAYSAGWNQAEVELSQITKISE
jgi:hypothetical protein